MPVGQVSFDISSTSSRRFYRLVHDDHPPIADFQSPAEAGRHYDDSAVQQRAEEVSVWVISVTGAWVIHVNADTKGTGAEQIKGWVVEVLRLP